MSVVEKVLPVKLSRAECDARGQELAKVVERREQLAAERKALMADYRKRLKVLDVEIAELTRSTLDGVEDQNVACDLVIVAGVERVTRKDTGELVSETVLTQLPLRVVR